VQKCRRRFTAVPALIASRQRFEHQRIALRADSSGACGAAEDRMVCVRTHEQIDQRSLAMAERIVAKIDADPQRAGLAHAREVCTRWIERGNVPAREWIEILSRPWNEIREILLDDSEEGRRLRQNDPFCGILSPRERWEIYREAAREAK
jgi:hypothetical protein